METKTRNLLIYLLEVISEACDGCAVLESDTGNPLYTPQFWDAPTFELDKDDIEVIESLCEYEPRLQELLKTISESR